MDTVERFDYSSVPEHAEQLRMYAEAIQLKSKEHTRAGLFIGETLLRAKVVLEHGHFQNWCATEARIEPRSAQNYMNAATLLHSLQERGEEAALYQLEWSAVLALASPSANEETIAEVLVRVSRGERMKVAEVQDRVRQSRTSESKLLSGDTPPSVDALAAAVDVAVKKLVLNELGEKPRKEDAKFMKWLRLRFANDVREEELVDDWANA